MMSTRVTHIMNLAYPKGRPDVSDRSYPISVRFAPTTTSAIIIQIKRLMESSTITKPDFNDSTLFQIAARIEEVPALPPVSRTISVPGGEKIAGAKSKVTKPKLLEAKKDLAKKATNDIAPNFLLRTAPSKKDIARNRNSDSSDGRKIAKFRFEAPEAKLVKLAADFTDWEKTPIDMVKADNGIWGTVVPLPPGHYSYRFIVDGQWCDDPYPVRSMTNPFGTTNSIIEVT